MTEEELFDLSDEELKEAMADAKADEDSPEVGDEVEGEDEPEEVVEEDNDNDDEIEDEEDLEQPEDQDSDDDGADDVEEEETDEDSEEKSEDEDLADEESEEKPEDVEEESAKETQPVQKLKYKANGKEFEFTQEEVLDQFGQVFGKAMDYTNKTKALAPYRKMISAMEEENLTQNDMNLMIDVLKGDKQAIAAVLERTGTDALDLDTDNSKEYQPNSYGRNETELAIKDVVDEISSDAEYGVTQHVIESQWDDASRDMFVQNPTLIKELHKDVVNGVFDKVSPMALKMKVLDGGRRSDINYYVAAGQQYYREVAAEETRQHELETLDAKKAEIQAEEARLAKVKADTEKRASTKQASKKRKAAAPTRSRGGKKAVMDYLDDSDEAFDDWYKKTMDGI